jgi:hypothetical protein
MPFISDITINISSGALSLSQQNFRPLILGTGATAATGVTIASKLTDLTDAGYLSTDEEYLMASAMLAQSPHVSDFAVYRKSNATDYDDALTTLITTFDDFYAIVIQSRTGSDLALVGTWANSNKKFFFGCSEDPDDLTGRNVDREAYLIHDNDAADYPECAWVGGQLSKTPGSNTWKWKKLSGQDHSTFTSTQLNAIRTDHGQALQKQAGVIFTNDGVATSGEFIDIILGQDWVEDELKTGLLALFLKNDKIAMDDKGIAQIEGVIRDVLKRAGDNGIIAAAVSDADKLLSDDKTYIYQVVVPLRADISVANRAARNLAGVEFVYTSAGAVHRTTITGYIEI